MAGVVWHSVSLTGFGPYGEKATCTFPAALGVLVAPNETGKSTLVAGLMATLYGLPTGGSAADFGQRRYRHLGRAPAFEGEVEFTAADGLRYHVWRDFDSHQVVVTRHGPDGPERIHQGVHNPGARRGNQEYERLLARLVGLPSRELMAATFCVTQPLPEMGQVDQKVQELLAGAGGGRPQQALEWLSAQLRNRTRAVSRYGFPRDLRNDRELEELQAQIRELTAAIEQARAAVDGYHQAAGQLQETEAALDEARRKGGQLRQVTDALQEWQRLAERRAATLRQWQALRRALDRARQAEQRLRELRAQLEQEWPELAGLPPETGDRLQELIQLEAAAAQRREELKDLKQRLTETTQQAEAAGERLRAEFGDVAGRAELPRDVAELRERLAELERLEGELDRLAREEARLASLLAEGPDWGRLGHPAGAALRRVQALAGEALRQWARCQELAREVERLGDESERYDIFAGQPADVLELVRNCHVLEADARRRAEVAATRTDGLDRELRRLDEEEARLRQEYAAVTDLDEATLRRAEEKVSLLARQQQVEAELSGVRQAVALVRARSRRIGAAAGAVLGTVLGWSLGALVGWLSGADMGSLSGADGGALSGSVAGGVAGPVLPGSLPLTAAVALAVLGALLGWVLAGRGAGGPGVERLRQLERQARDLAAQLAALDLGPLAPEPPLRLTLIAQQWQEWRRRSAELAERRRAVSDTFDADGLREACRKAEAELQALAERLRPFTERFGDPAAALAEWQRLTDERNRIRDELDKLCRETWGVSPPHAPGLPVTELPPRWAELADLAELAAAWRGPAAGRVTGAGPDDAPAGGVTGGVSGPPGLAGADRVAAPARLADLIGWIACLTEDWWSQVAAAAEARAATQSRLDEVAASRRRLTQPGPDGTTPEERLRRAVALLRERVAPFDEHADPAALQQRVAAAASLKEEADSHRAAAQTLESQVREAEERLQAAEGRVAALRSALAPALEPVGGDPEAALARWQAMAEAKQQVRDQERERETLLTTAEVPSVEALERKVGAAELEWGRVSAALEDLIRQHPGLPALDEADDPLVVQERIQALRDDLRTTQARLEQLEEERRALRDRLQDLGRESINLAEAEMQLAELRRREQALVREIRALAIAYRELEEAQRVYQETYRERLEAAATEYWAGLTGRSGRRVRLSEDFAVSVVEPDGSVLAPAQLSKGAQDQLYLALRLAVGDLIAEEVRLPFVFDDPFLNCDDERLEHIRAALDGLARERQVLLLSHRAGFEAWGAPAELR
ncbi:AAA family ATPase [Symbiobacterium terraclitae]|uniref:AAA family ATPase n=1 Tax=Symbiobacterium terraclitae TaxID=557451 RepID=UPI0035B561D0